jgi:hypothetical protein
MRLLIASFAFVMTVAAADRPSIPRGAVKTDAATYHYTDAQGKKWIYRRTPFGIARLEDRPAPAPNLDNFATVKVVEDGDVIRFERPGPFGTYRWDRRKTQLDKVEEALWKRARAAGQD